MADKITILIVDDDRGGRESLEALLLTQGYNLILARSGLDAIQKVVEKLPDLVLLDVMMPGMDGYEVCRRIRNNPQVADIPILMLTALTDYRSRLAGFEAGADDYITKPYDSMELFARVRTVSRLNRYRRLLTERAKFQQLFDRSPNGQALLDQDGRVQLANDTLARLVNAGEAQDLKGQHFLDWVTSERREPIRLMLEAFWKEPQQQRFETWLAGKEQMLQPVDIILSPIDLGDQLMIHLIAIDIREKLKITGALAKERNILKAVLDISQDFIYCKDLESRFMMANPALAKLVGVQTGEELVGKTDFDFFPREMAIRFISDEQSMFQTGRPIHHQEEMVVDSQGKIHTVLTTKVLLSNHRGQVIGLVGFGREISDYKSSLAELQAAYDVVQSVRRRNLELALKLEAETLESAHFISSAGREIEPALQDLGRFAGWLSQAEMNEEQKEAARSIYQSVYIIQTRLSGLRDFSSLKMGSLRPDVHQFHLANSISATLSWAKKEADERNLVILVGMDDPVQKMLVGDDTKLDRILFHLVDYAIGMARAGEIQIRFELENVASTPDRPEAYLHGSVGFESKMGSLKNEMQLFEIQPEKSGDTVTSRGFGLSVSKRLAEAMGGALWAENGSGGLVFHLTIPIRVVQ
jgi:PAS domain S-box-containing protein